MMRNPRTRKTGPVGEPQPPAYRNYASLSDAAFAARARRLPALVVSACVAALVVTGGWLVRSETPSAPDHRVAAPVAAGNVPLAPAPSNRATSNHARPSSVPSPHVATATVPRRAGVAGVRIVARGKPVSAGVQRITISPSVSPKHAASVETAVLHNMITGLESTPRLRTTHFRNRLATTENFVTRGGVAMSALCVQWTSHTAYLISAQSGLRFAKLLKDFQPR